MHKASSSPTTTAITNTSLKRHKHQDSNHNHPTNNPTTDSNNNSTLVPGLPNHLAHLILSPLPPSLLHRVSRSWRRLLYSPFFPTFFSLYTLLSPTKTKHQTNNSIHFFSFNPISSKWCPLPPPPPPPPLHLLRHHPSFVSRNFPIQSLTVSNHHLVLIAATNHHFLPALSFPLVFDPIHNEWFFGPPLSTPRRWCATGSYKGVVYVASGVGSSYQGHIARSVEKWDMKKNEREWEWEKCASLKDGRFSREAVEAIGYKGKLWMVNVKGKAVKQGAVYDVETDRWWDMEAGVLGGWTGPVAVDGEDGVMYMVDEARGVLRKYDMEEDIWEEVVVEGFECLKGAQQMDVWRGRVCVVMEDGGRIAVVDVVARPARIWVVDPPPDMEVVSVHILPRMSLQDC